MVRADCHGGHFPSALTRLARNVDILSVFGIDGKPEWIEGRALVAAARSLARRSSLLSAGALPRDVDRVDGVEVLDLDLSCRDIAATWFVDLRGGRSAVFKRQAARCEGKSDSKRFDYQTNFLIMLTCH